MLVGGKFLEDWVVSIEIASANTDEPIWRRFALAQQRRLGAGYRLMFDWGNLLYLLTFFGTGAWQIREQPTGRDLEPLVVGKELVGWQFPPAYLSIVSSELATELISGCSDWQALDLRQGDWLFIGEEGYSFAVNAGGFARVDIVEKQRLGLDLYSWSPLTEGCTNSVRIFAGRTLRSLQTSFALCLRDNLSYSSVPVQRLALEFPRYGQLVAELTLADHHSTVGSQVEKQKLLSADVIDSAYFYSQHGSLAIRDAVLSIDRQGVTGMVRLPSSAKLPPNTSGGINYILRVTNSAVVIDLPTVTLSERYHEDSLYSFVAERSSMTVVHFLYLPATA